MSYLYHNGWGTSKKTLPLLSVRTPSNIGHFFFFFANPWFFFGPALLWRVRLWTGLWFSVVSLTLTISFLAMSGGAGSEEGSAREEGPGEEGGIRGAEGGGGPAWSSVQRGRGQNPLLFELLGFSLGIVLVSDHQCVFGLFWPSGGAGAQTQMTPEKPKHALWGEEGGRVTCRETTTIHREDPR